MDIQIWIIGQIILDIVMAALLVWFIIFQFRKNGSGINFEDSFRKSESILSEMASITQELEKNLEEKRRLSNRIFQQLDDSMKKADESRKELHKLIREYSTNVFSKTDPFADAQNTRKLINSLLDKGMQKTEVSQHLGISLGELDLLLKLQA